MHPQQVAVLMTVHNRRETTAACLRALFGQQGLGSEFTCQVYLVDDGSTDGTAEAVAARFPEVTLIAGTGSLFWAAGMAKAEAVAARLPPDAYFWLNDDTVLFEDALIRLLEVACTSPPAVAVGATRASDADRVTYGGRTRTGAHPLRLGPLREPVGLLPCDTFEGNAVLVPAAVRDRLGPIDGDYPHAYADTDYGLRAAESGIRILQVQGYIGICDDRPPSAARMSLRRAWQDVNSPKGLPWRAQMKFLRRHGDWRWPWWLAGGQVKQVMDRTGWSGP